MKGLIRDINRKAIENTFFRQVLESGENTQIVIMSIAPDEEIGNEVHKENDQILYFLQGEGKAILNGEEQIIREGDIILVQAGTEHNFINTGDTDLKIITTYSPPHHPEGTIHKTKEEASRAQY